MSLYLFDQRVTSSVGWGTEFWELVCWWPKLETVWFSIPRKNATLLLEKCSMDTDVFPKLIVEYIIVHIVLICTMLVKTNTRMYWHVLVSRMYYIVHWTSFWAHIVIYEGFQQWISISCNICASIGFVCQVKNSNSISALLQVWFIPSNSGTWFISQIKSRDCQVTEQPAAVL